MDTKSQERDLAKLSFLQQRALTLSQKGLNYVQIGLRLGVSAKHAGRLVKQAKKKLEGE